MIETLMKDAKEKEEEGRQYRDLVAQISKIGTKVGCYSSSDPYSALNSIEDWIAQGKSSNSREGVPA